MLKKIVAAMVFAGLTTVAFATDARIETMGGTDRFFQDEMSIHRNPANMGVYGNILFGSYGRITPGVTTWGTMDSTRWAPTQPFFGGVITFGQREENLSRFTVGATFNRVDSALNLVAFDLDRLGLRTTTVNNQERVLLFAGNDRRRGWNDQDRFVDMVGKVDLMFAYTLPMGTTIGLGAYLAFQDGSARDLIRGMDQATPTSRDSELTNRFIRGNLGVNTPIGDGVDLEASVGISALTLVGAFETDLGGSPTFHRVADNDIGVHLEARMFAGVPAINGAFVPSIRADIVNYGDSDRLVNFSAGIGLNVNIDRGFFWTGFYGLYNRRSNTVINSGGAINSGGVLSTNQTMASQDIMGGKIGFGIERNVLTNWFVIRVGGSKMLARESLGNGRQGTRWIETNDSDHVSLGMGVNIEDRLKIDFTIAQNLPYTFTNLFSDSRNPYLASRVSAVFAF